MEGGREKDMQMKKSQVVINVRQNRIHKVTDVSRLFYFVWLRSG